MPWNQSKPNHTHVIYIYKEDLALNNLQWLIYHKSQSNEINKEESSPWWLRRNSWPHNDWMQPDDAKMWPNQNVNIKSSFSKRKKMFSSRITARKKIQIKKRSQLKTGKIDDHTSQVQMAGAVEHTDSISAEF